MNTSNPHDNQFEALPNEQIRGVFQNASRVNAKLQMWTERQQFGCVGKVLRTIEGSDFTYYTVPRETEVAEFERAIREAGIEEVMCSLHLPTDLIYFRAQLRRPDAVAVQFKIVPPVYKLQRRRALRIPFSGLDAPRATVRLSGNGESPLSALVANLSEGGLGLLMETEADYRSLPKGTQIAELTVTLPNFFIHCAAEVRHAVEHPSTARAKRQFRIGLQFLNLPEPLREQLSRYILEESVQFLGRL